jgi:glucuronyl/N-acetylglucosaminyl transferase EXT1
MLLDGRWNASRKRVVFGLDDVKSLAGWGNGRNHVVLDLSDAGLEAGHRLEYGCAMVGMSHADVFSFIHGFDISMPLLNTRPGIDARLRQLMLTHSPLPAGRSRRYWLSFRGTTYMSGEGWQRSDLLVLRNWSTPSRPISVSLQCHTLHGLHKLPQHREWCSNLERETSAAPSFEASLNTTFALLPGGRQPATLRLNEVLAAGAIPVFITGDGQTGSPYVLPFDDAPGVDWSICSLHFAWHQIPLIPSILGNISDGEVARLQRDAQRVWKTAMAPSVAPATFYSLLRMRATGRG